MKNQIIIIFAISLFSCEKVINIDLNEGNPRYVMEGNIIAGESDFILKITKTTSYFNPQIPESVNNAVVELSDGNTIRTLNSLGNGIYHVSGYPAQVGKLYKLKVEVDGNIFEAKANIPDSVSISSLAYVDNEIQLKYNDPRGTKNYYRIRNYKNGTDPEKVSGYSYDDFGIDGTLVTENLFFERNGGNIISGDTIYAELQSINEETYTYLNTLDAAIEGGGSGPGSTSPANPTSNWSNNGLGYFGGESKSSRLLAIP